MRGKPIYKEIVSYEKVTLDEDYYFKSEGMHFYKLILDKWYSKIINNISLKNVLKKYKEVINVSDTVEIKIDTPLFHAIYELNKEDGHFYLIEEGKGYA